MSHSYGPGILAARPAPPRRRFRRPAIGHSCAFSAEVAGTPPCASSRRSLSFAVTQSTRDPWSIRTLWIEGARRNFGIAELHLLASGSRGSGSPAGRGPAGVAPVTIEMLLVLVNEGICERPSAYAPPSAEHRRQARHQPPRQRIVEIARIAAVDRDDQRRPRRHAVLAGIDRNHSPRPRHRGRSAGYCRRCDWHSPCAREKDSWVSAPPYRRISSLSCCLPSPRPPAKITRGHRPLRQPVARSNAATNPCSASTVSAPSAQTRKVVLAAFAESGVNDVPLGLQPVVKGVVVDPRRQRQRAHRARAVLRRHARLEPSRANASSR